MQIGDCFTRVVRFQKRRRLELRFLKARMMIYVNGEERIQVESGCRKTAGRAIDIDSKYIYLWVIQNCLAGESCHGVSKHGVPVTCKGELRENYFVC